MRQTKEQAQIELQNALTTTFLANLVFLSEYDKDLYHRVDELSRMIENGTYKEKYALEFNMKDGEFDIYDLVNDKYLYDKQPKKKNAELVRKVELDKKQSIFNIENIFTNEGCYNLDVENRFNFSIKENLAYTSNKMQDYKNITKENIEDKKKRFKKIDKFIFLGTLLGRHIPKIAEKIDAKIYLVLEKNLEIFRLSLFTVDYKILAKKDGVIFSIMDDENSLEKKIYEYIVNLEYENYLLKFSSTNINIEDFVSKILGILSSQKPTVYDFHRTLYAYLYRSLKRVKENYNFLQFEDIKDRFNYFNNTPVLYIAAGPSLDDNLEWIKKNQNKFIIVCIGSSLGKLIDNNIRVDIVITLDEQEMVATKQFNDEVVSKISEHTILFSSAISHEKVLAKFNKDQLFIFEAFRKIYTNNIAFSGYSIGEMGLDILLKLNAKNIYIVGLDLALNQETGESHSKDSNSGGIKVFDLNKEDDREFFSLGNSTLKVKGNSKDEVVVSSTFYLSINYLNQNILINKKDDVNIYNLSENGAYFINTKYLNIEEIDIDEFKDVDYSNLKGIFEQFSKTTLDKEAIENSNFDYNYLKSIKDEYLKILKSKKIVSYKELYEEVFKDIYQKLQDLKYGHFYLMLENYYSFIIPYLNYHFNDIKIKNESKKVDKIKDTFLLQLENLIDDYLLSIKNVLNID